MNINEITDQSQGECKTRVLDNWMARIYMIDMLVYEAYKYIYCRGYSAESCVIHRGYYTAAQRYEFYF